VLPTGAGKTICFSYIAYHASQKGNSVLIIVHRQELIYQTSEKLTFFGLEHGIISPEFPHTDHSVQIAMVQTLCKEKRLLKTQKPSLLVIDEAHHSCASNYKKIIKWADSKVLGVTATPCRLDGKGLGDIYDDIIVGVTPRFLIDHSFLSQYKYYGFPIKIENKLKKIAGEYTQQCAVELGKAIVGDVVGQWQEKALNLPTIVFCPSVCFAKWIAQVFVEKGYNFKAIDGDMAREDRKSIIKGLADGTIQGITSCDVISEGTDIPVASCAILMRKTASTSLFLQQVGRVLRPVDGKTAVIIDMVQNYVQHGSPCQDRDWSLNGSNGAKTSSYQCEKCYCVFARIDENGKKAVKCPECGEIIPVADEDDERKEREIELALDYDLTEVDFLAIKKAKNFIKMFKVWCRETGKKDGFAFYTQKRWAILSTTPDKATIEDWSKAYAQEKTNYDIGRWVDYNVKLYKEFSAWVNQKALSKTK
jgi:superfamily II DNA or RNA helicase